MFQQETDLSQESRWYAEQLALRCQTALVKNNFGAIYAPSREEAREKVLGLIPEGAVVGIGDSISLLQAGIVQAVEADKRFRVLNPFHAPDGRFFPGDPDAINMMRQVMSADVFLTGTNAVTLDGKLVNVDGFGNRVAALAFGPKKVILLVGVNKIVANVEEALARIRQVAAPLNARRHLLKHGREELPCTKVGYCTDCRHPRRICCATLILEYQRHSQRGPRITVVLVGEELGL